jgi:flavin-dependent dehydrogenase
MEKTENRDRIIASSTHPAEAQPAPAQVPDGGFADPKTWGLDIADSKPRGDRKSGEDPQPSNLQLVDGSRVAVVGGGPAGTLFSYFLLDTLALTGTRVELDIYEPRLFSHSGPSGCNHCGGVVSESLVQLLATEGIQLPAEVVQRGIDSYQMHMDVGQTHIETPLREKRIAAVYRGNGPRQAPAAMTTGFDRFLLQKAIDHGARWQQQLVSSVRPSGETWQLQCAGGEVRDYDLLVVASGVNSALLPVLEGIGTEFRAPTSIKTFIAEFKLGKSVIESSLGTSMHVFLLDIPRLEFAALIPKGDYVTLVMLGDRMDEQVANDFLNADEVRGCFPDGQVPKNVCHCFPNINIRAARQPYQDRLVLIGDSGVARLYKDGIGSAYRTAKAAAMCCALHGISSMDFRDHYWSACRLITRDNAIGKLIFMVCHVIQKLRFTRRAVLRMVEMEQSLPGRRPLMSSVLWDVFSGSAPYTNVLFRTLHPAFIAGLVWNLLVANLPRIGDHREKVIAQ